MRNLVVPSTLGSFLLAASLLGIGCNPKDNSMGDDMPVECEPFTCAMTSECNPQLEEECVDGCCVADPPDDPEDVDGSDECFDSTEEEKECEDDMDVTAVEGTCTTEAATVRITVAGGPPNAEPTGSNQRQCLFLEGDGGSYVVMTASANDGPYTCSALLVAGGPPTSLPLGAGDGCGVSADGEAIECVLTAATAGFVVTSATVTTLVGELSDEAGPVAFECPW